MAGTPQHATLVAATVSTFTFDRDFDNARFVIVANPAEVGFTLRREQPGCRGDGHLLDPALLSGASVADAARDRRRHSREGHLGGHPEGDGRSMVTRSPGIPPRTQRPRAGIAKQAQLTSYTTAQANTVYTVPAGAKTLRMLVAGGGAGGGSGRQGAAGTVRCAGGSGGAGGYTERDVDVASLSTGTLYVTVGTGGTGGAAVATSDTNGNAGVAGDASLVATSTSPSVTNVLAYANGGGGGAGGTNATGTAGIPVRGAGPAGPVSPPRLPAWLARRDRHLRLAQRPPVAARVAVSRRVTWPVLVASGVTPQVVTRSARLLVQSGRLGRMLPRWSPGPSPTVPAVLAAGRPSRLPRAAEDMEWPPLAAVRVAHR